MHILTCSSPFVQTLCESPPVRNKSDRGVYFVRNEAFSLKVDALTFLPILILPKEIAVEYHAKLKWRYYRGENVS